MINSGTGIYAQGVEVPETYSCELPKGFEIIKMPPCKMLIFQGTPYNDDFFEDAIENVWKAIDKFNPELYGYKWSDNAPSFQMEPQGYRGYIEGRAVVEI